MHKNNKGLCYNTPVAQNTPTPTPIVSPDPTPTPTPSPVVSNEPEPVPTPVVSPDTAPTPIPTPSPTPTPTVSPDPTPTPTPEREPVSSEDIALSEAEYAISHVAIGYQNGDNPDYVTGNLTLPESVDEAPDVSISWTSNNPGTISSAGTVNRQASDTGLRLTATASVGSATVSRDFELTVIRQRSRTVEQAKAEIRTIGVTEIRAMNASNDELQITYTASRDRVTDIDGKYVSFDITNADDALDAVQSLHGILGINAPYQELEPSVITSDTYGAEYTF